MNDSEVIEKKIAGIDAQIKQLEQDNESYTERLANAALQNLDEFVSSAFKNMIKSNNDLIVILKDQKAFLQTFIHPNPPGYSLDSTE